MSTNTASCGFSVYVITEDVWTEWAGDTGLAAALELRAWLQANYINYDAKYVLLIGDPYSFGGDVPMMNCTPDSTTGPVQTDAYYADLHGNWALDYNTSQAYGTYYDFTQPGGPSTDYDVIVGRIPFVGDILGYWGSGYDATLAEAVTIIDTVLSRTIAYENTIFATTLWRNRALLPMAALDANYTCKTHLLGEAIKTSLLAANPDWSYYRIYAPNCGLTPPPEAYFPQWGNWDTDITSYWTSFDPGLVIWLSHGSITQTDYILSSQVAPELDNCNAALAFQTSCCNAGNDPYCLAEQLLAATAVTTVASTQDCYYNASQTKLC